MKADKDALARAGFFALGLGFTLLQFITRDKSVSFRQAVIITFAVWVVAAAAASIFMTLSALLRRRAPTSEKLIARIVPWAAVAGVVFGSVVIGPQLEQPGVAAFAIAVTPGALTGALMIAVSIAVARGHGIR